MAAQVAMALFPALLDRIAIKVHLMSNARPHAFDRLSAGAMTCRPLSDTQRTLLWTNQISSGINARPHYLNPIPTVVHSCLKGCSPAALSA